MGVLLMLMTIGGLVVAAILLIVSLITKKRWLTKFTLGGVAVWLVFYTVMLLGFSLARTEEVLASGEAKEYCGFYLDCHMHTAVTGVRAAKTIGDKQANGQFYIVDVKVFSDAKNPNIALHLITPKALVVLPDGGKIERDMNAEAKLPTAGVVLDADIHNNETIEKEIVFDVPANAANPKLLITEGYGIDKTVEHLLVGDEDSLFHAQTFFVLKEQNLAAGVK
jgi:hypothetical protein